MSSARSGSARMRRATRWASTKSPRNASSNPGSVSCRPAMAPSPTPRRPLWMTRLAERRAAGPLPAEEGLHEAVDVPVEDGLHVARLVTGAEVLHLLVRRLDVR